MSIFTRCMAALLAGSVVLLAGCVDNGSPDELPPAWDRPANGLGDFGSNGPGFGSGSSLDENGFGAGAGDGSLGANADWQKIPGRLGFPNIYYAYDSDALAAQETAKLDAIAAYLGEHADLVLIIEGNCDERGTEEYNRALGERRAISVMNYLSGKGVASERMRTISFGKDNPAVQGSGETVWAQNRRSELCPARTNGGAEL